MFKRNLKFVLVALVSVVLLTTLLPLNCSKQDDNVIKIGAIFSLTGDVGAYGQRSRKGFELAVDIINSKGGINGKLIETVIEDAKSLPRDGLAAYKKLLNYDKIHIIVGDVLSSTTMAIVPQITKNKVLLFAPGASNPQLKGASKYFFRNWTSDDFDGYAMAHYMNDINITKAAILVQSSDYTIGLADAFEKEFKNLGGEINIKEEFATGDTDIKTQLSKIKASGIKTVYLIGQSRENGTILRQAKEMNFKPNWYANLTVNTPECAEIAKDAREGVIFTTPAFDVNSGISYVDQYVKDFQTKYNEEPEATSAHAYDAVMILASVIEKVGTDPDSLSKYLKQVKNFPGVSGKTSFDSYGDVIKDVFVKKIVDNKVTLLKHFEF